MKERERQVKDLALICRPLMIALCTAYCFIVIMFGIVLISSPPTRDYTDPEGKDFYQFARLHFGFLLFGCFVSCILSALFITATYVMRIALAIPYFTAHLCFIFYMLFQSVSYFRSVLGPGPHSDPHYNVPEPDRDSETTSPSPSSNLTVSLNFSSTSAMPPTDQQEEEMGPWNEFAVHVLYHHGVFPLFGGIMLLALFIYTTLPQWNFIHELYLYRKERKLEDMARQGKQVKVTDANAINEEKSSRRGSIRHSNAGEDIGGSGTGTTPGATTTTSEAEEARGRRVSRAVPSSHMDMGDRRDRDRDRDRNRDREHTPHRSERHHRTGDRDYRDRHHY